MLFCLINYQNNYQNFIFCFKNLKMVWSYKLTMSCNINAFGIYALQQQLMNSKYKKSLNDESNQLSFLGQFKGATDSKHSYLGSQKYHRRISRKIQSPINSSHERAKHTFSFRKESPVNNDRISTISAMSNFEDYYKDMELSLIGENSNLKEQNNYLIAKIKKLFQRQKKYKKILIVSNEKVNKLEYINKHLKKQLHILTGSVIQEIQRIQKLVEINEDFKISASLQIHKSREGIGWETESTLNNNLSQLKQKMNNICNEKFGNFIADLQNDYNYSKFKINPDKKSQKSERQSLNFNDNLDSNLTINSLIKFQDMDSSLTSKNKNQNKFSKFPPKNK